MTKKSAGRKPKQAQARPVVVVATNPDYERFCADTLTRLPWKANVELLSFSKLEKVGSSRPRSMVVVSRLSDISKQVLETAFSGSATKQLVFLDELPVEAMATRLMPLNIRNPERIHIAAESNRSAIEGMIHRLVSGLAEGEASRPIVDAWIEKEQLVLLSPSFCRLEVPLAKLARFIGGDKAKAAAYEIDEDGRFLHWPHADVHLGWMQFQQLVDPTAVLATAAKTDQYNKRYGAAIRAIRESHGLKQKDVHGITDRQLRRVEQGQQTASKGTLEALAKAHSLSLEKYVDRLAEVVNSAG